MHKFYEDLKGYILNQEDELKKILIPYYEALYQLENYPEMKKLLEFYRFKGCEIKYNKADAEYYYSNGHFEIYEEYNPTTYKIELNIGAMKGNYCVCQPSNEEYNSIKGCCGIDCDVHLPEVNIVKIDELINHEFQGYECDLWKLEDKWNTEYDKELLHKQQLYDIKYIEDQITEYQKALEVAKSQLREN